MRKIAYLMFLAALLIAGPTFADDKPDADKTPDAVVAAAKKLAGDAKYELEKETKGKTSVYVAEWEVEGKDHEAVFNPSGKLLKEEAEVDAESVPAVVREAAAKVFGADAKMAFDKITIHGEDGVKVLYDAESGDKDLTLDAKGTVVEDDDDDDEDDEDDDDDDEEDDEDDDEDDD